MSKNENYIVLKSANRATLQFGSDAWIKNYCQSLLNRIVNLETLQHHFPEGKETIKPKLEAYYKELMEWKYRKEKRNKQIKQLLKK